MKSTAPTREDELRRMLGRPSKDFEKLAILGAQVAIHWEHPEKPPTFKQWSDEFTDVIQRLEAPAPPAAERTALESIDEERLLADFYLANEKKFGRPNGDERAIDLELVKFAIGYVQGFLNLDAASASEGMKSE